LVGLSPDELVTTTRAVRRRLDLSRPVERRLIEECVEIAAQAPNAGNRQEIHFVVVTDSGKRASLAEIYRKGASEYFERQLDELAKGVSPKTATVMRVFESAWYLHEHLQEVPVHVIPCLSGVLRAFQLLLRRPAGAPSSLQPGASCSQVASEG
jgi:nitroreductase